MKIYQEDRLKVLTTRVVDVKAIVIHNTGATNHHAILHWYRTAEAFPHFYVNRLGEVYQFCPENKIAHHCGLRSEELDLYERNVWRRYIWPLDDKLPKITDARAVNDRYAEWDRRWPGKKSPLEILGPRTNGCTIGVELQNRTITDKKKGEPLYTPWQMDATRELIENHIAPRHGIKIAHGTVIGHYDLSPLRRANREGNWDPGPIDWQALGVVVC